MRLKNNTKVVEILHQRHTKKFYICTPCAQIYIRHPFQLIQSLPQYLEVFAQSCESIKGYQFGKDKHKNELAILEYQSSPVQRRICKTANPNIYRSKITQKRNQLSITGDSLKTPDKSFRALPRKVYNVLAPTMIKNRLNCQN